MKASDIQTEGSIDGVIPIFGIKACARCAGDHPEKIDFLPLQRPDKEWTHWAICPNVKEPIFMSITLDGAKLPKLSMDTDDQVFFYEQEFYVLSNFSSFRVLWKNIDFQTAEHAYHWAKFHVTAPDTAHAIRNATSAHDAFKIAQRNKVHIRPDWEQARMEIMRLILRAKVGQHEYVKRKLMETGERELIENSWRDSFWGWGEDRKGQNWLGRLWMEVRNEIHALGQYPNKR